MSHAILVVTAFWLLLKIEFRISSGLKPDMVRTLLCIEGDISILMYCRFPVWGYLLQIWKRHTLKEGKGIGNRLHKVY